MVNIHDHQIGERKTDSIQPGTSSFAQPAPEAQLSKLLDPEQSIESVELPTPAEHWYALDTKPLPSISTLSQYQEELRVPWMGSGQRYLGILPL